MKRFIAILAATAVALCLTPAAVPAAETDVNEGTALLLEESPAGSDEVLTNEEGTVLPQDTGSKADAQDGEALDKTENSINLDELIKQLPDDLSGFVPYTTDYEIPFVTEDGNARWADKIPEKYNVYEKGELPPVRDQKNTMSCWAHALLGAVEADLIHDKKATTDIDLSEMQLAYYFRHSADPKNCRKDSVEHVGEETYVSEGGLPSLGAMVMSNLIGAIPDKEAPLSEDADAYKPGIEDAVSKDIAQIRNVYRINSNDKNAIKKAVMEHGGVAIGFHAATTADEVPKYYNGEHNAFYVNDADVGQQLNHGVMIVGWDDKFPSTNFTAKPEGDGAWLIRNSWGKDEYHYMGYFWMSYYDKSFPNEEGAVAVDADMNVFNNCYAYDGTPFFSNKTYYKMTSDDTFAVTYDVSAHEAVKGVGFELGTANASINISAKNLSTGQSVAALVKTGAAGVYTAVFDKPLEVYEKATVRVTINGISDDGKPVKLGFEDASEPIPYQSYTFKPVVDRGFIKNGEKCKDNDLRVKLYTDKSDAKYTKVTGVKLDKAKATLRVGETLTLKATVSPKKATFKDVTWKSSNERVATVDENGVVTPLKKGSAKITVTTSDGKFKASCKLTVNKQIHVKSISLSRNTKNLKVGDSFRLRVTIKPDNATVKDVTWKSSNSKIATVTKNGKVKGIKKGKVKITVTTKDGGKTASCEVNVKKK